MFGKGSIGRMMRWGLAVSGAVGLLALATTPLLAQEGEIKFNLQGGLQEQRINLLSPVKNLLSGRAWLIASGLDPSPVWGSSSAGVPSRLDWSAGAGSGNLRGPGAPVAQAAGPGALVPFREAAPAFSRNILITRDFSSFPYQTEPHLAVDPNDPDHLVLGVIDYNFPSVTSYVSIDGGSTWKGPFQTKALRDDLGVGGDPVVAFDREGRVQFAYISIGVEEFSVGPFIASAEVSSIAMAASGDGGLSWSEPISSIRSRVPQFVSAGRDAEGRNRGNLEFTFLDKPWMTIGPHPTKAGQDVIYVTYTEFLTRGEVFYAGEQPFLGPSILETTIKLVRSEDGGKSWSSAISVSPTVQVSYDPSGVKRVLQGSQPAVAPDGTVYVTWFDSTDDDSQKGLGEIYLAASQDGGKTFGAPVRAAAFNEISFRPRTALFRFWASAFPQIVVGPNEELYIAYVARPSDRKLDDGDVYLTRSLDQGRTWSRAKRLNQDETDRVQFFPSVAVSPNGQVHVMWGDMRDDPAETSYHIYYTRSEDRGETFGFEVKELGLRTGDTRVTDFPSNPNFGFPNGVFLGDYFSIKATDEDVYMVWADTRLGEFGPLNQKIGFARRTPIQSPQLFISPPAGPGGQDIVIQGYNFQPNLTVFVQIGGVTVSTARTNAEGRLSTQVFVPVSGEGSHAVQVFDDSGNVATGTFFTEFGFDTIRSTQDAVIQQLEELRSGVPPEVQADLQALRQLLEQQGGGSGSSGSGRVIEAWLVIVVTAVVAVVVVAVTLLATRRRVSG